jgi:glyoxylase-like metal-dependent hydrolase (beta-lactamase superfamily II)
MAIDRIDLAGIELLALLDGNQEGDAITEAFPDAPPEELLAYRDRYPGVVGGSGGWQLRVRAWLVRHPGGALLVDTGIGAVGSPAAEWFGTPGQLMQVLAEAGTDPAAIDTVVISHVHDDHVGGTVAFDARTPDAPPTPAFPNARYVIQRADWEWQQRTAKENDEDAAIYERLLRPLQDAGLLDLIEGDTALAEGIGAHHLPGHTPGHQIVRIGSGSNRAVISADAFNHPAQLSRPQWASGPDADRPAAARARRALIAELLLEPDTIVAPTHFEESFGHIVAGPDGLPGWLPA